MSLLLASINLSFKELARAIASFHVVRVFLFKTDREPSLIAIYILVKRPNEASNLVLAEIRKPLNPLYKTNLVGSAETFVVTNKLSDVPPFKLSDNAGGSGGHSLN